MIKKVHLFALSASGLILAASLSSCYYDNVETLTAGNVCDTSAVSYANDIVPVLQGNCYVCHGTGSYTSSGAGILVEGYEATADLANTGFLTAVIDWTDGASPMPQGSPQIPACERPRSETGLVRGAQNN